MSYITKSSTTINLDREIVAGSSSIIITNGDGVAGNTEIDVDPSNITLNSLNGSTPLNVSAGGTGSNTASSAINALLPAQGPHNNHTLMSNGTSAAWQDPWYTLSGAPLTVSATSGTLTSATISHTGTRTISNYTFLNFISIEINITTNGTASGALLVAPGNGFASGGVIWNGFETTTGIPVYGYQPSGVTLVELYTTGNVYPGFDGANIVISAFSY